MGKRQKNMLKDNPLVKQKLDSLSRELAGLLVEQFEQAKNNQQQGESLKIEVDDKMKTMFEEKGKDLGNTIQELAKEVNNKNLNKANNRKHIVKVSMR